MFGDGKASGLPSSTAVLCQETHQVIHGREVGGINHLAAHASLRDQSRPLEVLQMEREGGWRDADALGDDAGRQPVRPLFHEHSVHGKPVLVSQRTEGVNCFLWFHGDGLRASIIADAT